MKRQEFKQETAYEMELAISTFHNMLEPLEEYIGKLGCYPDWVRKRQLYRNTIKDSDDTLEGFEDLFLTQLLIVTGAIGKKPSDFRKRIQEEYYRWISATGIDTNNIPPQTEKLKHYLFEINEVLEGRGERVFNQTKELVKGQDIKPQDALWLVGASQKHLNKSDERKNFLKGKTWNQLENKSKFSSGSNDQGEQAFGRISEAIAGKHKDFHFYPQTQQQGESSQLSSDNPLSLEEQEEKYTIALWKWENWEDKDYLKNGETREGLGEWIKSLEIVRDIDEWDMNWIMTFNGYGVKDREKRKFALFHSSVDLSPNGYDSLGQLNHELGQVYYENNFLAEHWNFIRKSWIENIKKNIREWRVMELYVGNQRKQYLVHELVQRNERNQLILDSKKTKSKDEFAVYEWGEIQQALNNYQVIRSQRIKSFTLSTKEELINRIIKLEDEKALLEEKSKALNISKSRQMSIQREFRDKEIEMKELKASLNSIVVPNDNGKNFPKPLIFISLGLVILTVGLIVYKVRKNKVKK